MKNLNKKILIVALIFSIITASLSYSYLKNLKNGDTNAQYIDVVIASKDIMPREQIKPEMIKIIKIPKEDYVISPIKDKGKIIGMFTKEKILKGELIRGERLINENEKYLSYNIPNGKRALSIAVNENSGVADLIKPNDYIDVYVTLSEVKSDNIVVYPNETKLILQNVQVLAIGKEMAMVQDERKEIPNRYSITLALNSLDAEKLILGEEIGHLKLVLRPAKDNGLNTTWGSKREDLMK